MKLLIITNESCDLADVLRSCPAETKTLSFDEAIRADICGYDAFCVFGDGGMTLDARLRLKLENEADRGKRIFLESIGLSDLFRRSRRHDPQPADISGAGQRSGNPRTQNGESFRR